MLNIISRVTRRVRPFVLPAAFSILTVPTAMGQTAKDVQSLQGLVVDEQGLPIPNAQIALRYLLTGSVVTRTTNGDGQFAFPIFSHGSYRILASSNAFAEAANTFEIGKDELTIRHFDAKDFLTYQLAFDYDEDAACAKWTAFLDDVLPDVSKQMILAEFIGYVFAKHLKLEKTMILYGTGANGNR